MLCDTNILSVIGFRGIPGATPNLTATVATGAAGSNATVTSSGTNAQRVFHFTIPRGDPGLNDTGAVVNTVADLRVAPANGTVTTLGCIAAGDGGGGFWRWDSTSALTDNIGTVVLPTGHVGNGRWVRQFDGSVLAPEWFGATGDGITDDSDAFQYALDASAGKELRCRKGKTYKVFTVLVRHNTDLNLNGATIKRRVMTNAERDALISNVCIARGIPNPAIPTSSVWRINYPTQYTYTVYWGSPWPTPMLWLTGNAYIHDGILDGNRAGGAYQKYASNELKNAWTYRIAFPGDTDWMAIGAPNNNEGTIFSANSSAPSATGTGIAELPSGNIANSLVHGTYTSFPEMMDVTIERVTFNDSTGIPVNLTIQGRAQIIDCVETNAHTAFCDIHGRANYEEPRSVDWGTFNFIGNRLDVSATRNVTAIANTFFNTGLGTVLWRDNYIGAPLYEQSPKLQTTLKSTIANNTFENVGIKGYGNKPIHTLLFESFVCIGNTLFGNFGIDPMHDGSRVNVNNIYIGLSNFPCRSVVFSGNSFTNGSIWFDSYNKNALIDGNTFTFTEDWSSADYSLFAISCSSETPNVGTTDRNLVITNNSIDLPEGTNTHGILFNSLDIENVTISNNRIRGGDHALIVGSMPVKANTTRSIAITKNHFSQSRTIARFVPALVSGTSQIRVSIIGNVFENASPNPASVYHSGDNLKGISFGFTASSTGVASRIEKLVISDNYMDSTYTDGISFAPSANGLASIGRFVLMNNTLLCTYASTYSLFVTGTYGYTIDDLILKGNYFVKHVAFGKATLTNSPVISGNTFPPSYGVSFTNYANYKNAGDGLGETSLTVGASGAAAALPAAPFGYLSAQVGTSKVKIPYYNS